MHSQRLLTTVFVGLVALFSVLPTWAQNKPQITLSPVWSAATVLTSLNNDANTAVFPSDNNDNVYNPTGGQDDEVNYVSLDLTVTTDSEIWAFDTTCWLASDTLEVYPVDTAGATDNPTDDQPSFRPSNVWGTPGSHFTQVGFPYTPGSLRVAVSRMGQRTGLGINGQQQTFSLGKIMLRVKPQAAGFDGFSKMTCSYTFINRNGVVIGEAPLLLLPSLFVREGYTISGKVNHQAVGGGGIGVSCQTDMSSPQNTAPVIRTDATGGFRVSGLRTFGYYRCQYFANLLGVEAPTTAADKDLEPFLAGQSYVPVFLSSYTMQPIVLRAGNTARSTSSEFDVDLSDISAVTGAASFGTPQLLPHAFDPGDANGDQKINRTDLALVTSNYGVVEYVSQGHYLVAGQIPLSPTATDSRVYIATTPDDWAVQDLRQLIPGSNRDFWPTVSPDGSQIAFIRSVGTGTANRYALFVMPAAGTGTPLQLTPANADYDAFAPSWSPDGRRLAFIRTPLSVSGNTLTRTYGIDKGWLTLVDMSTKTFSLGLNIETRIYPATWANTDQVIYGSTVTHTLETLHILANTTNAVDESTQGSGYEDMPNFVNGHLYYRYEPDGNFTTVDAELRFATPGITTQGVITGLPVYTTTPIPNTDQFPYHITVPTSAQAIAYYSVDGARETLVMQYAQGSYWSGNWQSAYLTNAQSFSTATPIWFGLTSLNSPLQLNPTWNGNSATPTDLHALRNTIRWLP